MMHHCDQAAPEELLRGIEEFNRGDWFDCHETLEDLWVGEKGEMRDFYQGLLQMAVALHHWRDGNFRGAILLLEKGANCLRRVRPVCQEVDVDGVVAAADRFREALTDLGAERMEQVDPDLVPRLRLAGSVSSENPS